MARRPSLVKRKPKVARVTRSEQYLVNKKHLGDEPASTVQSEIELARNLSWYSYMCTAAEAREYLNEYLTGVGRNKDIKKLSRVPDSSVPLTAAWIARMISRGYKPAHHTELFLELSLEESLKYAREEVKHEEETPKVSIQDRMREKSHDIVGEIEGIIDDTMENGQSFSLYKYLQENSIPVAYVSSITQKLSPYLEELIAAYEGDCPQLKEAYKHLTKKQLRDYINFFNGMIEDAERYSSNTKQVRKVQRKPRVVSIEKKLKNLRFQKEDAQMKLASIDPAKIIGAQELWTYNTKYKLITVYRAIDRGGLQVNRSSIGNIDEKTSMTRRCGRRPEEYIKRVLDGGKLVLRKIMEELKEAPLANRVNENTILLRVVQ